MADLQEIEKAVKGLGRDKLAEFSRWFIAYEANVWDQEFDIDVAAGKLDVLADEALRDLREGRCEDL